MISDQQLVTELALSGRPVTRALLADWRKSGLLPPLNTRGLGRAGKAFFWTDSDIVARAQFTHDGVLEFRDPRRVRWLLWIAGFDVSIGQLKRAWLSRLPDKPSWTVRQTLPEMRDLTERSLRQLRVSKRHSATLPSTILDFALLLCEPLALRDDWVDWKSFALFVSPIVGGGRNEFDAWTTLRLTSLFGAIVSIAGSSNLVASATADELRSARAIAAAARPMFRRSFRPDEVAELGSAVPPHWSPRLAANLATPLLLASLLLLRAGRQKQLSRTLRALAAGGDTGWSPGEIVPARVTKRLQAIWRDVGSFA